MIDLYEAIYEEDIETIKLILKNYPDRVNERDENDNTPLHKALCCGKHNVASLLLSYGANVCVSNNRGYTPLHEAVSSNDIKIRSVRALLEKGADVNAKAEAGYEITPLDLLATEKTNNPDNSILDEIAELLIQSGAHFYKVPVAAIFGTIRDVEDLISTGADIDSFLGNSQLHGLHIAAKFSNLALAQLLINRGAFINASDLNDKTPLEYASSAEIEELLRRHGCETSDEIWDIIYSGMEEANKFRSGLISGEKLLKAAKEGNYEEVNKIMTQPVETGGLLFLRLIAHNVEGKTALQLAAENGHKTIVEYLLSQGMRVNAEALNDSTAKDIRKIIQDYNSLKNDVVE
jgi:ankyrin repeat protein